MSLLNSINEIYIFMFINLLIICQITVWAHVKNEPNQILQIHVYTKMYIFNKYLGGLLPLSKDVIQYLQKKMKFFEKLSK